MSKRSGSHLSSVCCPLPVIWIRWDLRTSKSTNPVLNLVRETLDNCPMRKMMRWMPALLLVSLIGCSQAEFDIQDAMMTKKPGVYGTLPSFIDEDGPETRMNYYPENGWDFEWTEGDPINIWSEVGTLLVYSVTKVDGKHCTFDGGGFKLDDGMTYYSSYPIIRKPRDNYKALSVVLDDQKQTANGDPSHLNDYFFICATATCENGNTAFAYDYKVTGYVRFVVTLPKPMTVTELSLISDSEVFAMNGTVDVTTGAFTPGKMSKTMSLALDNITVDDGVLRAYMAIASYPAGSCSVRIKDSEGTVYTSPAVTKAAFKVGGTRAYTVTVYEGETAPVALIGDTPYATFTQALSAAQDGDVVKLLADYDATGEGMMSTSKRQFVVSKSVTIDGQGHTLVTKERGFGVGMNASSKIDVTFRDITINNTSSDARCIDTRGNIGTLTLENVTLSTDGASGYTQPLTIGGNQADAATVNITNSTIETNAEGTAYYAIITFNPVNMTISGSTLKGWACIYAKGADGSAGSAGSVINIDRSSILSTNEYSGTSNAFAAFMKEDDNVTINVTNSDIKINSTGDQYQTIAGDAEDYTEGGVYLGEGNTVTLTGETALGFLNTDLSITGGTFNVDPTDFLAPGYCAVENDGLYTVEKGMVASVNGVGYATLAEAIAAVPTGTPTTITILQDISDAGSVNIPANVTLEGSGHVISGNSSLILGNGATVTQVNFQNIHNSAGKLSAVYGSASATVTNCTFTDCDWDSIQFTPVAGSVLTITGNTFEETSSDPNSVTAQRFVHIQSAANVDFSATVTGNKMSGTTAQGRLECYYFTDRTKIDLTHNYIDNRNGANGVCILEKSGANVSEMVYPVYTDADMTTEFTPVAIVKEPYSITEYETIQAAFDAQDGKVIAVAAGSHAEVVNVTGGKTATFQPMVGADVTLAGINHSSNGTPSTVTVKDITIDNGLQTEGWFTGTSPNINPCVGAWGGHFTFDGCTFKVSGASKYETGIMTWWVVEKTTFDFDNCVFEASDAAGNKPSSARAMQIYGDVDMTVDGCTFTTAKSYSLKYVGKEGSTAVFNDNTVSNSTCFVQLGSAPYAGTGYSLSLNNTTYSGEIAPYVIDNEENQTVYIDGVKVYPGDPVHIGSNSYATIQAAFNAAQNGDVITVDAGTYNEVVDVTGGKTVTIQATAGADVAMAGINHSSNGTPSTVTVKSITIDNGLQTEGWFTGTSPNINPCVGAWGGHFTFDGCTFKVSGASKYETGIMTWWVVEKTTFDFDNCVFEASDAAGNKPSSARAMQIYGDVDMTVDGCTFTTAKSYSLKYVGKEGSTAVFNDNTVSNSTCFVQLGSAPYAGTGYSLSLNNTTYSGEIAPYVIDNEENQTVYIDGVKVYPAVPDYETDANGNLSIYTAAGMQYFASQVNDSGVSYSGKTVTLMDNIDMTGIDWIPVGQTGGYAALTYFRGTFDGNGKTISNLTVTHWEEGTNDGKNYASGLFGFIDAAGATVKDLTMDNANVTGSHWTGAIVGYLSGEISGCTVKNSSVVCTNKNSEANGDKAGLITGYINGTQGTVTNCTGSNGTVQAYRDAGQLVGAAKSTQVSGCTATNVTVTGTGGGNIRNEVIGRLL